MEKYCINGAEIERIYIKIIYDVNASYAETYANEDGYTLEEIVEKPNGYNGRVR